MGLNDQQFSGWTKPPSGQPQQGTLFPQPKPTDDHRWPQGFTPERKAEAANIVKVGVKKNVYDEQPNVQGQGWFGGHHGQFQARVLGAVARSTMEGVPEGQSPHYAGRRADLGGSRAAAGMFDTYAAVNPHETSQRSAEHTLLHELGHSASMREQRQSRTWSYGGSMGRGSASPALLGQEEAFADDHRITHWREDKRDAEAGMTHMDYSGYESIKGFQAMYGKRKLNWDKPKPMGVAHKSYLAARTTPLEKDQADAKWNEVNGRAMARFNNRMNGPQQGRLWSHSDEYVTVDMNRTPVERRDIKPTAHLGEQFGEVPYEDSLPPQPKKGTNR